MKLVLETKPGTEYRKSELTKLRYVLYSYYDEYDPFNCRCQCENDVYEQDENDVVIKDCAPRCIRKHVDRLIEEIDREGVLYF